MENESMPFQVWCNGPKNPGRTRDGAVYKEKKTDPVPGARGLKACCKYSTKGNTCGSEIRNPPPLAAEKAINAFRNEGRWSPVGANVHERMRKYKPASRNMKRADSGIPPKIIKAISTVITMKVR